MSPTRQTLLLTALAGAAYVALRSMPDTHCSFLHAAHEPVLIEGVQFCGENEEANFYDPAALGFPFSLRIEPSRDFSGGSLRVLDDAKRPVPSHLFAVSHTRQLHLHLRQGTRYAHVHPEPSPDGTWSFRLPEDWPKEGFGGGKVEAYADFQHARSLRTILLSASASWPLVAVTAEAAPALAVATLVDTPSLITGDSVLLRVRLSRPDGTNVKLQPLMGALGHAVLFSADGKPGYSHIHPSFTGRERGPEPELAFRIRLPAAGAYDLFVHLDDEGREGFVRIPLRISARE